MGLLLPFLLRWVGLSCSLCARDNLETSPSSLTRFGSIFEDNWHHSFSHNHINSWSVPRIFLTTVNHNVQSLKPYIAKVNNNVNIVNTNLEAIRDHTVKTVEVSIHAVGQLILAGNNKMAVLDNNLYTVESKIGTFNTGFDTFNSKFGTFKANMAFSFTNLHASLRNDFKVMILGFDGLNKNTELLFQRLEAKVEKRLQALEAKVANRLQTVEENINKMFQSLENRLQRWELEETFSRRMRHK
ncbi:hypothetical protein QBC38DRAFT_443614 [Podospora fimiseda]|uniref:Uncharacterized protein n=1 Tax=Podospora fimiseda TaxID=252190 RepID=A0AAN7H302_9PEZI|nr:hypothetical protein QBC38DRAFT_443614 [Podospora fimiseda]